jgi:hypothetical protein
VMSTPETSPVKKSCDTGSIARMDKVIDHLRGSGSAHVPQGGDGGRHEACQIGGARLPSWRPALLLRSRGSGPGVGKNPSFLGRDFL